MKPIVTVNTGEYLAGLYIEQHFKELNVWIPSRDTGVDLLVTDQANRKTLGLIVKLSKDYTAAHLSEKVRLGVISYGSWTFNTGKLSAAGADFCVLVLHAFDKRTVQYVIVKPGELLARLAKIHGRHESYQSSIMITSRGKCWESKGLTKLEQILVANNTFRSPERDFTRFVNAWNGIRMKKR